MNYKRLIPVALVIALISGLYILIAQYFQISALWLPYISWASYFMIGGKTAILPKLIAGFFIGMLIGLFTVLCINPISVLVGTQLALPLIVFVMVFIILLFELVESIDLIPAYFLAYTSYFAYYYGGFGGAKATPFGILPLFFCLLMIGLILGVISVKVRKKIY